MGNSKTRILLGQFMTKRSSHPDTPENPFTGEDGQLSSEKDFLESDLPDADLQLDPYTRPAKPVSAPALPSYISRPEGQSVHPRPDGYHPVFTETMQRADDAIKQALTTLGDINRIGPLTTGDPAQASPLMGGPFGEPGSMVADPFMYAQHITRLGRQLSKAGLALFAIKQFALHAMNRKGKIWNPLTIAPIPLTELYVPNTIDAKSKARSIGEFMDGVDDPSDIHLDLAQGNYSEIHGTGDIPFVQTVAFGGRTGPQNNDHSIIGAHSQDSSLVDDPSRLVLKQEGFGVATIVEAALTQRNFNDPFHPYSEAPRFTLEELRDQELAGVDVKDRLSNAFIMSGRAKLENRPNPFVKSRAATEGDKGNLTNKLARAAFENGIVPVAIRGENKFGFTTQQLDDDDAYVPLVFTDLRPVGNLFRSVYFRAFITSFTEEFHPEWLKSPYMGRADPVATYAGTVRLITLGFKLIAFQASDLKTMYQKLNWLTSMVYPEYDLNLLFKSGPITRLRVGNVIDADGAEGRGVPGIIENLAFDYSESIWELEKDWKVPRNINISLTFTALHDRPIGRGREGKFGGLGQIKNGLFVPPGAGEPAAGSNADLNSPEVEGIQSFRRAGKDSDLNGYDTLYESDHGPAPRDPSREV